MTPLVDPKIIAGTLERQGIALPPDRQDQVAAAANRLTATSQGLDQRLSLSADIYGFQTLLRQWELRR
jgi:hypothetical protein